MKTKIVVDSAANLYALEGVDFACVPLKIITDHEEYRDDGTLDAVGMATTLRTYKGKTSTSCPNVSDWLEAFEGADEVYAITITGTLSGCYNAAQLAAEEYQQEHPGKRVFVLDSLSTGPEQRLRPSTCGTSWRLGRTSTPSVRRCSATTSTRICSSRWNRWRIWPAMAG